MSLPHTVQACREHFERWLEDSPHSIAFAPGRVNLIGEHIDYNDGIVLPMAINRHVVVAGRKNGKANARVFSTQADEEITIDLSEELRRDGSGWRDYIAGVLAGIRDRGIAVPGFDALVHSLVPVGSGLSSSAALEVAMATFLETIVSCELGAQGKANLCRQAEHDFAQVPCGIMDQFASVFGKDNHLVQIDCQTQHVDWVPWPCDEVCVLIADTHAPHRLVDGEYAARRKQTREVLNKLGLSSFRDLKIEFLMENSKSMSNTEMRRARHVVSETQRAIEFAEAISKGDWGTAGELMYASHDSLRDDYEVSCDELDGLVEIARSIGVEGGVLGARMTGGGFGGCTVSLVRKGKVSEVSMILQTRYTDRFGLSPTVFSTPPCSGAGVWTG